MNDVRLPIETTRDGNKITKVCVEDVYKMINRIESSINKMCDNSREIMDSIEKKYWPSNEDNTYYEGWLIVGTGISQPCGDDEFDEETGNNIAFMKAKLNANIKKYNIARRVYNELVDCMEKVGGEMDKILDYIDMDLGGIREYNPDYFKGKFE